MSKILQQDKRHCWHPFTQHQTERDPVVVTSAKGACLYDEEGNEMLDMIASWWTCVHGHAHPAINDALYRQAQTMEHVMFGGFTHPAATELSEKITALLPGDLNRVFFSDNGSTAVEVALKLSYQYWQNKTGQSRSKFLAFEGSYHGDTLGAMSVGKGCGFFKLYDDLMIEVDTLPYVHTWDRDEVIERREQEALHIIENKIAAEKDDIAALIVEPLMQGAGGIRFSRPEFMRAVTKIAQQYGILVIYDEVAVGFGRSGSLFACEQIGVTPDFICLSKGLTAGYLPMSLTVATDRVFDEFLDEGFGKAFLHGHSFTANPLACAVALKSLELFEEEKTIERIAEIEKLHKAQLERFHAHPMVYKPRVMGSAFAFNLSEDGAGYKTEMSEQIRDWFLNNGLNIRPLGDAVYLMPPYCITKEQLEYAYDKIFEALSYLSGVKQVA